MYIYSLLFYLITLLIGIDLCMIQLDIILDAELQLSVCLLLLYV